jgi:hypothetical protein
MTDAPPSDEAAPNGNNGPRRVDPDDDLVERTLEKAADKVASVTVPGGPPVMNRMEAFAAVAVLVILNMAGAFVGLQIRAEMRGHRQDFKTICQIIVEQAPQERAKDLATRLAECLQ